MAKNNHFARNAGVPHPQDENPHYTTIYQNNALNQLALVNSKRGIKRLPFDNKIEVSYKDVTFRLAGKKVGVTEQQFLAYIRVKFAASPNHENRKSFFISTQTYMDERHLKDRKSARNALYKFANQMGSYQLKYDGGNSKHAWDRPFTIVNMFSSVDWVRSGIIFTFTNEFHDILVNGTSPMPYHKAMLLINPRTQQTEWYVLDSLLHSKRQNEEKPRADTISIRTLLQNCTNLPTYDEVMQGNGNVHDRIIEPIYKAMNTLSEPGSLLQAFTSYQFLRPDNQPFDYLNESYETFFNAKLKVEWLDYPVNQVRKIHSQRKKHIKKAKSKSKREHKQ